MTTKEIYEKFDNVGCLTFATVTKQGLPETRIAHLRGYDDQGIYFMTMYTKDFYKDLINNGHVSVCGLSASSKVEHDQNGFPIFEGGYAIRMTGTVKEISIDELKAKNNPVFDFCIKDHEIYKAMVVICITSGYGDVFDYDFEKKTRENKLERIYFSFGGHGEKYKGLKIDQDKCISCGVCQQKCSFLAIKQEDEHYFVDKNRCDECGDCLINCPVDAITHMK